MHHRACFRSGPRMDHQSCRLFDNGQILVLVIDLERDLLRCDWRRLNGLHIDFDALSASDSIPGFLLASVDTNGAGAVQHLDLRASEGFEALGEKHVQAETSVL